jgi:hypothetical protein
MCDSITDLSLTEAEEFWVCDYWEHKRIFKDSVDTPINCEGWSGEIQEEDEKPMAARAFFR